LFWAVFAPRKSNRRKGGCLDHKNWFKQSGVVLNPRTKAVSNWAESEWKKVKEIVDGQQK